MATLGSEYENGMIRTNVLLAQGKGAHAYAELEQDADRPEQLGLRLEGYALELVGTGDRNSVAYEVRDPAGIRALGECLLAIASRGEALGMLEPARQAYQRRFRELEAVGVREHV